MNDKKTATQSKSLVKKFLPVGRPTEPAREASAPPGEKPKSGRGLAAGIAVSVVASFGLWLGAFYVQSEMLSAPGEPVVSAMEGPEAVQIARSATFAVGSVGAVVAILLAYRRQRSTETAHWFQVETTTKTFQLEAAKQDADRVAAMHDRYTRAVTQLGDKKSAIRLGGVHAVAALGDDWSAFGNDTQRQACIDLLCSYLRSGKRTNLIYDHGDLVDWEADAEHLEKDRDPRKAALEWLSRIATEQAGQTGTNAETNVQIDLRGISLRRMDLRFARLSHLPLESADLEGTRLNNADLTEVKLTQANLSYAHLTGAILTDARLDSTKFIHSKFGGANLERAQLHEAVLKGAALDGANLLSADFGGADLTNAILKGAKVDEHTSFTGAVLEGTDFTSVAVNVLDQEGMDISKAKGIRSPRRVRAADEGDRAEQDVTHSNP